MTNLIALPLTQQTSADETESDSVGAACSSVALPAGLWSLSVDEGWPTRPAVAR